MQHNKKSLCNAWIWSYLTNYKQDDEATQNVGEHIKKFIKNPDWDWAWPERHEDYGLFNATASKKMGGIILSDPRAARDVMIECGLTDQTLQQSGLAAACFQHALSRYADIAPNNTPLVVMHFINKLKDWACLGTSVFAYESLKAHFMESLLLPWVTADKNHHPRLLCSAMLASLCRSLSASFF